MLVSGVNPVAAEKDVAILKASGADWQSFLRPMEPFLLAVSDQLREQVAAFEPEIASYAEYALSNQGKQLRPSLVGCAGNAAGGFDASLVKAAVIVEMVHLATLVHDDIMDEASVRRRRPTLCARSGNEVSVLLGDCLFARALELASDFPTTQVCRLVARATRNVCTGEIIQTLRFRKNLLDREQYLHTLKLKTAELFALSCELGGLISGLNEEGLDGLREYGFSLGIAYQIYDDCLDIFGDESQVGKSLGTDLATGKLTLPVLQLLEKAPAAEKNEIKSKLFQWNGGQMPWLMELLKQFQTLEDSNEVMQDYVRQANTSLSVLEGDGRSQALKQLLAYLSHQIAKLSYK
jgi:octaprenyl-diphosphate synthase